MAKEITMPKLSDTMEEGKVLRWLKTEGETVKRGDVIAEVETDKADMEMEAFDGGVLLAITVPAGGSAAVGETIGWIGSPGETVEGNGGGSRPKAGGSGAASAAEARGTARAGQPAVTGGGAGPADSEEEPDSEAESAAPAPAAGRRASSAPEPPASAGRRRDTDSARPPAGNDEVPGPHADIADIIEPEGGEEEEEGEEGSARQVPDGAQPVRSRSRPTKGLNDRLPETRAPRREEGRTKASPVARRLAEASGLDLDGVVGTGPDGRIVRRDVEAAVQARRPSASARPRPDRAAPAERTAVPVASGRLGEELPHTKLRRAIASRMAESKRTVPHFYTTAAVRMDEALRLKDALALREPEARVSVSHLILKAVGLALDRHPRVGATFEEDRIRMPSAIDVGLAVAVDDGLIVPVIRDVAAKPLPQLAREARDLVERVRTGKLAGDALTGAVFSISNMGMFPIESFAAIIAPPQSAILAVGAITDEAVVRDGSVFPGKRMRITLSADHRVIDGTLAAAFVVEVQGFLETPLALVL